MDEFRVCVLEKGAEVGAHILSGAVVEPRALDELLPEWREDGEAPLKVKAGNDSFMLLTETRGIRLPTPPQMLNDGNYVVSLGNVCRWLGEKAEALGVEVYPGTPARDVLYDEAGAVKGVVTADMGVGRDGAAKDTFAAGMELHARLTVFSEGCRGSLTKQVERRFDLRRNCAPQTYALGIKEVWQVDAAKHFPGTVVHSVGWPLDASTYGGSFLYHMDDGLVSIGFVVGLDYSNPYLSPYREFQRFKTHPSVRPLLEGGEPVAYGARALVEGGLQSIPELVFPGGLLVGDAAGFLNVPKIKGTHTAMKSGMLAADAAFDALKSADGSAPVRADAYPDALRSSWVYDELHRARNIRPYFSRFGLWGGMAAAGVDTYLLRGNAPWTLSHSHADHEALKPAAQATPIDYPKPDGKVSFSLLENLARSGTNHEEDQPIHLQVASNDVAESVNRDTFDGPEGRYCPAGVYEWVEGKLVINAQNCLHCKTCDIKDPKQNINWVTPEGGGGPLYSNT